jgi:hypothetical protein
LRRQKIFQEFLDYLSFSDVVREAGENMPLVTDPF